MGKFVTDLHDPSDDNLAEKDNEKRPKQGVTLTIIYNQSIKKWEMPRKVKNWNLAQAHKNPNSYYISEGNDHAELENKSNATLIDSVKIWLGMTDIGIVFLRPSL